MKLMGKDITTQKVLAYVGERLRARGLAEPEDAPAHLDASEGRVDPLTFNLQALSEHADATRPLPIETHRGGLGGRAVVLAKALFRRAGQVLINEALSRQVLFNGYARDSYAQLSAEVMRLRERLGELESELQTARPPPPPLPKKSTRRRS